MHQDPVDFDGSDFHERASGEKKDIRRLSYDAIGDRGAQATVTLTADTTCRTAPLVA
jgi:hypothetical protein